MRFGTRVAVAIFVVAVTHVAGFVLVFIAPRFKKDWDHLGMNLSWPQRAFLELSDVTARNWYLILPPVVVASAVFVVLPYLRNQRTN